MIENLSPPRVVLHIARTLEKAGFETWCVGGAVRDAMLGHPHLDWDFATAARPEQVKKLFPRTVPVGIAFGTMGVLGEDGVMHEVTTFRRDVNTDGRHAVVEFGATIDEDLARRDYTINAIAFDPQTKEVKDPFDGRADLANRIVRAVGDPEERLREDRLRALRAIRFSARLDFEIEPLTWKAILGSAPQLGRLSAERVKQEIEKTMDQVRCPSVAFAKWQTSGAFGTLIPSLATVSAVELRTIDQVAMPLPVPPVGTIASGLPIAKVNRRILRLIALFAAAEPGTVLRTLKDLRFSNADASWIAGIVTHWSMLAAEMTFAMSSEDGPLDPVLRRWAALTGRTRLASVLRLAAARWAAERAEGIEAPPTAAVHSAYRRAIRVAYRDPVEVADLAVDGSDLAEMGITGPKVGQMLRLLLETVITEPALNTRGELLAQVRRTVAEAGN